MSENNTAAVLGALQSVNGYIALGLQVGNIVVPLVKGLITAIRKVGEGTDTVSYEIVVRADLAELDQVVQLSTDDLAAINAELARLGAPTLPVPETPASGSSGHIEP